MIRYFDSSALVKRYVREEGTAEVGALLEDARIVTCRLTEAEISSALARRRREGSVSAPDCASAIQDLRKDLEAVEVVELAPAVVARVHALLDRHLLRAADALHLAAAIALREQMPDAVEIVAYDERLKAAARAEGFLVRP